MLNSPSLYDIANNNNNNGQQVPPYFRSIFVIPITVAIVVIVIACSSAYAYVKYEERRAAFIRAGILSASPSKQFQYISGGKVIAGSSSGTTPMHSGRTSVVSEEGSLSIRYIDSSDKSKPLLSRPPIPTVLWAQQQEPIMEESDSEYPSPYATLPCQKFANEFTSFKTQGFPPPPNQPPPPPPPNDPSRRMSSYVPSSSGASTSYQQQQANMFCMKADVHHNGDFLNS